MHRRWQRAERNQERRRSRQKDVSYGGKGERLRQGAAPISASANLATAVSEEGEGYAVGDCGVNRDGAATRDLRAGNSIQPEMIRAAASLPLSGKDSVA